jgi:predicted Zn-dependent protease
VVRSVHACNFARTIRGRTRCPAAGVRWAIALIALVAGCQPGGRTTAPRTRSLCGEAEAIAGSRAAAALEERLGGTVAHAAAIDRMRAVERRLARGTPELRGEWQYRILASDRVDAFSLPGGLIYITRGLYERRIGNDNDLLAAALAHEMAHVIRKDSLKPARGTAAEALEREMSADRCAARYLQAAGYDARCLTDLLRIIEDAQPPGWAEARIQALGARPAKRANSLAHSNP